jgi:colanic acid/amylovoran biosynthesis glycosyltransferase
MITGLIDNGFDVFIYTKKRGPEWQHPNIIKYNLMQKVSYGKISPLHNFDIVLAQFGYRGVDFVELIQKLPPQIRPLLITCFRGADITKHIKQKLTNYDQLFTHGSLFLPVCDYFKDLLIKNGCDKEKIKILYSAIDCQTFVPTQTHKKQKHIMQQKYSHDKRSIGKFTLISTSRLVEKKGITYAIQAVAKLLPKYPNLHYNIVGFGELYDDLKKQIKNLNATANIHLLGRKTESEIIPLLQQANLFTLPSITAQSGDQEGIPNAAKEAMSCGLPVILTEHAGNAELVIPGTGLLVEEKNVVELANAIEYFMKNPQKRLQMGHFARKYVTEKFDTSIVIQELVAIIHELFARHKNHL